MEQYQKQLDQVMANVVSRKEFLRHMGVVFVALFGVTSLIKNLHSISQPKDHATHAGIKDGGYGYGGGPYGR